MSKDKFIKFFDEGILLVINARNELRIRVDNSVNGKNT